MRTAMAFRNPCIRGALARRLQRVRQQQPLDFLKPCIELETTIRIRRIVRAQVEHFSTGVPYNARHSCNRAAIAPGRRV
jgi:hypothetical protein